MSETLILTTQVNSLRYDVLGVNQTLSDLNTTISDKSSLLNAVNEVDNDLSILDSSVVKLTGDQTIAGVKTFSDNMIINANLTVTGTTTTVNSTEVDIGDNIILLNSDETGTPSQNAGIEVERGTSDNVQLIWNETSDTWEVQDSSLVYHIIASIDETQTLTNKSIDADNNTISNLIVANLKSGVLDVDLTSVSTSDDTLASAKAVKTYVDAQVTGASHTRLHDLNNPLDHNAIAGTTTGDIVSFDANGYPVVDSGVAASQVTTNVSDISTNASGISSLNTSLLNYTTSVDYASNALGKGASLIGINDVAGIIDATDVEGALAELAANDNTIEAALAVSPWGKLINEFVHYYGSGAPTTGGGVNNECYIDTDTGSIYYYDTTVGVNSWVDSGIDLTTGSTVVFKAGTGTAPTSSTTANDNKYYEWNGTSFINPDTPLNGIISQYIGVVLDQNILWYYGGTAWGGVNIYASDVIYYSTVGVTSTTVSNALDEIATEVNAIETASGGVFASDGTWDNTNLTGSNAGSATDLANAINLLDTAVANAAGVDTLPELTDVDSNMAPTDGQIMSYDGVTDNRWEAVTLSGALTGDVTGSANMSASGALSIASTIAANAVESGMLNDNVISGQTELASGMAAEDELFISDAGVLKKIGVDTFESELNHDNLSGFVATEHVDHASYGMTAGSGLSYSVGTGSLSAANTIDINVDNSSIEIVTDTLQVKAGGITNAMLAGDITFSKILSSDIESTLIGSSSTFATSSAIKTYVDNISANLSSRKSVRVTTTADLGSVTYSNANGTITANANGAISIDGVALSANDRVLVKDQSAAVQNGIYDVTTVGDAGTAYVITRSTDYDATPSGEITLGSYVFTWDGTANKAKGYVQYTFNDSVDTIGTDAITFTEFSAAVAYTADEVTLTVSSNEFSIKALGVDTAQLADSAVTTIKINNGAVTEAKLDPSFLNTHFSLQSDYVASAGNPAIDDSFQTAISKIDGTIDNIKTASGGVYSSTGTWDATGLSGATYVNDATDLENALLQLDSAVGSAAGADSVDSLTNTDIQTGGFLQDGSVLAYNASTSKWEDSGFNGAIYITGSSGHSIGIAIHDDVVKDTMIDWGTGANQVSAGDVPTANGSALFTTADVESSLDEAMGDIDNVEAALGSTTGLTGMDYTSTNVVTVDTTVIVAISALDAEIGAAVTGSNVISDQAVNLNLDDIDAEIGAAVTASNYVSDQAINLNIDALDAQAKVNADNIAEFKTTTNGEGASLVGLEDASGYLAAANVEAGIKEVYEAALDIRSDYTSKTIDSGKEISSQITDAASATKLYRNEGYIYTNNLVTKIVEKLYGGAAPVAESYDITSPAGSNLNSSGSGEHSWIIIEAPRGRYGVYFNCTDSSGETIPSLVNVIDYIEVQVLSTDTAAQIASKTSTALNNHFDFSTSGLSGATFTLTNVLYGNVGAPSQASSWWTFGTPTDGTTVVTEITSVLTYDANDNLLTITRTVT